MNGWAALGLAAQDGTGAPGTPGVAPQGGPDEVTYSADTRLKGEHDAAGMTAGYVQQTTHAKVTGPGNWTEPNAASDVTRPELFLPGLPGNMPVPGDGRYQTGRGLGNGS